MTVAAFDTLKFARTLREKANMPPQQAEAFSDALAEAFHGDVASKGDVEGVRTDLRETEARLKADLRELELRIEAQIERSKAEVIKWMFGTIGLQTVAILGAVTALARTFER